MPFCPNCGSSAEGRFCQKCGGPIGSAASAASTAAPFAEPASTLGSTPGFTPGFAPGSAAGPSAVPPFAPPLATPAPIAAAGLTENVAGALCYLAGLLTGVVFLAIAPYNQNPRVRFHAFQSIFFNVAWVAAWMIEWMAFMMVAMVLPYGLSAILSLLSIVLWFAGVFVWLFLMWKAYKGETFMLPVIGKLAKQQAGMV